MSDDPELDKLAELRAEQWGCTRVQARERLLDEAREERRRARGWPTRSPGLRRDGDDSALFAASAFAAVTSIETGLWDRYLLRLQATIRARLATAEYGEYRASHQPAAEEPPR